MLIIRGSCDAPEYVVGSTVNIEVTLCASEDESIVDPTTGWTPYSADLLESYFDRARTVTPSSTMVAITTLSVELSGVYKLRREAGIDIFPTVSYDVAKGPDARVMMSVGQIKVYNARFTLPTTLPPTYSGHAVRIVYSLNVIVSYATSQVGDVISKTLRVPVHVISPISLISPVRAPYVSEEDDLDFRLMSAAGSTSNAKAFRVMYSTTGGTDASCGVEGSSGLLPYVPDVLNALRQERSVPQEIVIRDPQQNVVAMLYLPGTMLLLGELMRGLVVPVKAAGGRRCGRVTVHLLSEEDGYHRQVLQEVDVVCLWATQVSFGVTACHGNMHSFSTDFVTLRHLLQFTFHLATAATTAVSGDDGDSVGSSDLCAGQCSWDPKPVTLEVPVTVCLNAVSAGVHRKSVHYMV
eukprot:PhM_4_TR16877/c0_g1_i1/m.91210